jgi:hypothetical protein
MRSLAIVILLSACGGTVILLSACGGTVSDDVDASRADASPPAHDASTDAASADAARTDGARDSGPAPADAPGTPDSGGDSGPIDPCADRIFCDDFESYDTDGPPGGPWTVREISATVVVDGTRPRSGDRAVHIVTAGGDGSFRSGLVTIEGAPVFPVPDHTFYGRMMIYVAELPGIGEAVHWTNVQAGGPIPGMESITGLYRYGGMNDDRWLANYETLGAASDCWRNSETAMEDGRWVCMEWRFSQPEDRMQLWVDGDEITDVAVDDRGDGCVHAEWDGVWRGGAWERLQLGWEHYQQSIAHEVWIDDVVIDDAPIGCPTE